MKNWDRPSAVSFVYKEEKKSCPSVGPLRLECGEVVADALQMSEHFVDSFSSVFVRSTPVISGEHQRFGGVMGDVVVSPDLIAKVLSNLDGSSAAGPDGLHPHLLKACSVALLWPLFLLFFKSFEEGMLPTLWKTSVVAPLFKSGSRCNPLNYRPISLTSVCCKTMERVIGAQLVDYLELNNLLATNQFGFRKLRSVEDQLLLTYGEVTRMVDCGYIVDVVFLDFSKAFDVVSHSVVLSKLQMQDCLQCLLNGYWWQAAWMD